MTALAVELCGCSHAARMHERDEDAENGRGACMARGGDCGCSEFRPGLVDVEVPDPPVVTPLVATSEPVEEPEAAPAPSFPCPVCGKGFPSPQGRGGHRAKAHPGSMATKSRAVADSPSPEPDRSLVGAVVVPPAAVPAPAAPPGPVVVDRDVVLVALVRAIDAVVDGDACELVQIALDIQWYMDDRGWLVIDGGAR